MINTWYVLILFLNLPSGVAQASHITGGTSKDWAGYVAANLYPQSLYDFNSINGSWIVQVALPNKTTNTFGAQWIGISDVTDIQTAGTLKI